MSVELATIQRSFGLLPLLCRSPTGRAIMARLVGANRGFAVGVVGGIGADAQSLRPREGKLEELDCRRRRRKHELARRDPEEVVHGDEFRFVAPRSCAQLLSEPFQRLAVAARVFTSDVDAKKRRSAG